MSKTAIFITVLVFVIAIIVVIVITQKKKEPELIQTSTTPLKEGVNAKQVVSIVAGLFGA